jgi:succinoglycan biosynthesis protein ExoO
MNRNQRARLPRSLRSALDAARCLREQGFGVEILVLDEASRDGSQKLLRTVQALYCEPRLKVLELEQQLPDGASLRNLALETSASRYVYMLEAGDELLPENLPLLLRSAVETRAAMVYGNLLERQDGEVSDVRSNMPATLRLTRTDYVDACSIVDARRLLKMGGYAKIHPQAPEGWEMVLHLVSEEELIVFVPVVAGYRDKDSSGADRDVEPSREAVAALQSVHAQTGTREWDSVKVGRIYHPHVGFVEE